MLMIKFTRIFFVGNSESPLGTLLKFDFHFQLLLLLF